MSRAREELRRRLAERNAGAVRVLNTPDGKDLVEALERAFIFGDLLGETPEQTAFNLGAREVALWLRGLRALGQEGAD